MAPKIKLEQRWKKKNFLTKTEEQNLINKFKTKEIRNLTNLMSDIRIKKHFQKQILIFKIKCS